MDRRLFCRIGEPEAFWDKPALQQLCSGLLQRKGKDSSGNQRAYETIPCKGKPLWKRSGAHSKERKGLHAVPPAEKMERMTVSVS